MKKLLITIFALGVVSGLCFAAEYGSNSMNTATTPVMDILKAAQGKVESVSMADPAKGTKSEIVVVDDMEKKWTFIVKPTTTIYDAGMQPTALDKIKADDKVTVKYSVDKEGLNEAQSISLMK